MSGIYTALASTVFFPLQEKIKRHDTVAARRSLETTQWWSADALRELQLTKLKAFLTDIGEHVQYYRDLFRELDIVPARIASLVDLQRLPVLTKPIIRKEIERLKSDRAQGLARFNTGGSSGEPLVFYIGKQRVSRDVAAKWRATRWWGVDIGDPEIVVWGSPIELGAQDRMRNFRDWVMRTELLPAFEMSSARLDEFVARIRQRRPRMLFGYPSSLSLVARHAEKQGIALDDLGIQVAFVTAERLFADQRRIIGRVFGCKVANGYGGRDAGFIAHECPAGGMHITAEDIVVETLDAQGAPVPAGVAGEIVVTHLATGDFPFVRYRTGDIGVLDDKLCSCGRGLPLLSDIQGRTTDFLIARDGTIMHGLAAVYPIRDLPEVAEFVVSQDSLELTRVMVVAGPGYNPETGLKIADALKQRLGLDVTVLVEQVAQIPRTASGKHRYVQSKLQP